MTEKKELIPVIGNWCNINDTKYEITGIGTAGSITLETIEFGDITERKLLLVTLTKQLDKKGFYIPSELQKSKWDERKKRIKSELEILQKPEKELNAAQKLFCKYYLEPEHYGNGIQAYLKVYNCSYEGAKNGASRLLRNQHICTHMATLLDLAGFNDANVDKQTLHVINQMDDLNAKNRAISEYNKVKSRITQNFNHSGSVGTSDLKNLTTDELLEAKEKMEDEERKKQ